MGGPFQRVVGVLVALAALAAAALLWFAVAAPEASAGRGPTRVTVFGLWQVFYDSQAPSVSVLLAAVAVALLLAAGVALLEARIATSARRATDVNTRPLSPRVVMAATHHVFEGPVTVTVLIPAHQEEASIASTVASLLAQTRPPERVIVIADNCSDRTVERALAAGVEVVETVGNTTKKAGALNQVLTRLLPQQSGNDLVMVVDADTVLHPGFLQSGVRRFTEDRALMALGGVFFGEPGRGLIHQLQRNEYVRYGREIGRRRGRVFVLTGTASMFRPRALRVVAAQRGGVLPGIPDDVYDTLALTEDNELTIALKSLGALMVSPPECRVLTELMPTWRLLWAQRLRWQRGALENLGAYGVTRTTLRYWAQQLAIGYSVVALGSYLLLLVVMALALDSWVVFPFWLGIGAVFMVERVVTAWRAGPRGRLLALAVFPELFFDVVLDLVYVKGIIDIALGRQAGWQHLTREPVPDPVPDPVSGPADEPANVR